MSWSASGYIDDGVAQVTTSQLPNDESWDAYDAALEAAQDIVESGALGNPDARYDVSIVGHSNIDNEPVSGYAYDFVNLVVTQSQTDNQTEGTQ